MRRVGRCGRAVGRTAARSTSTPSGCEGPPRRPRILVRWPSCPSASSAIPCCASAPRAHRHRRRARPSWPRTCSSPCTRRRAWAGRPPGRGAQAALRLRHRDADRACIVNPVIGESAASTRTRRGACRCPTCTSRSCGPNEVHRDRATTSTATRSRSRSTSCWAGCSSTSSTTSTACCCSTASTPTTARRRDGAAPPRRRPAPGAARPRALALALARSGSEAAAVRLVYLGTPVVAVPPLRALVAAGHDVALVVAQPDRRRRGGEGTDPTPVKVAASELGLPMRTPERAREVPTSGRPPRRPRRRRRLRPDPAAPAAGRDPPRLVNVHFSLLPRWRGAAPVERAILAGDTRRACASWSRGRSRHRRSYAVARTEIGPDETAGEFRARLVALGTALLVEHLPAVTDAAQPAGRRADIRRQAPTREVRARPVPAGGRARAGGTGRQPAPGGLHHRRWQAAQGPAGPHRLRPAPGGRARAPPPTGCWCSTRSSPRASGPWRPRPGWPAAGRPA